MFVRRRSPSNNLVPLFAHTEVKKEINDYGKQTRRWIDLQTVLSQVDQSYRLSQSKLFFFPSLRASSYEPGLTGMARFPRSRLAALFFTKISMCSYEKAGWPGNRDLGFSDRDLGNRAGNFSNSSHMNTPARIPGRNIFNCAWLVRSLTGRYAVPRVFWWPFGHFSSR